MKNQNSLQEKSFLEEIRQIIITARRKVYTAVNSEMVITNWLIGKMIVKIQGGSERAVYGDRILKNISEHLTHEFGQGYDYSNLRKMRQFYLLFPNCDTLCLKLSWSHYRVLIRVQNPQAREYYAREAAKYPWSVRQLERQIHTQIMNEFFLHIKMSVSRKR